MSMSHEDDNDSIMADAIDPSLTTEDVFVNIQTDSHMTDVNTDDTNCGRNNSPQEYIIPPRMIGAVEVPVVALNLDKVTRALGDTPDLSVVLDANRNSLPFFLDPDDEFTPPLLSHNAAAHNVLLKVTVPKRTGRKRKKNSQDPWQFHPPNGHPDPNSQAHDDTQNLLDKDQTIPNPESTIQSYARLDDPRILRRRLVDNQDRYTTEVVGVIRHTHRYRGLVDFHWNPRSSRFATQYINEVMHGDLESVRKFTLQPMLDTTPNAEIIPPPKLTHMSLPFQYNYEQNPYVRFVKGHEGENRMMNITSALLVGHFVSPTVEQVPTGPRMPPDLADPMTVEILDELQTIFAERPIWTRRSLLNRLGKKIRSWNLLKKFVSYTAYQFKGGPFRDAVIAYGVDPRTDPKYRIYQTMFFKLPINLEDTEAAKRWTRTLGQTNAYTAENRNSHVFDGKSYYSDGKLWQVCDVTDPFLVRMLEGTAVRATCDVVGSGWYHQGFWAKMKAVMKCKLLAIRFHRRIPERAFESIHSTRDETPPPGVYINIRLPDLRLTTDEIKTLRGRKFKEGRKKSTGKNYNVLVRRQAGTSTGTTGGATATVSTGKSKLARNEQGQFVASSHGMDETGEDGEDQESSSGVPSRTKRADQPRASVEDVMDPRLRSEGEEGNYEGGGGGGGYSGDYEDEDYEGGDGYDGEGGEDMTEDLYEEESDEEEDNDELVEDPDERPVDEAGDVEDEEDW